MFEPKEYSKKVRNLPIICSLELSFDGEIAPMTVGGIQAFLDTHWLTGTFSSAYFTKASFTFGEKTILTEAGYCCEQTLKFRFPSNDAKRSSRISMLQQLKFIRLILNNGSSALLGINDFTQNAKMKYESESTLQITEITFTNLSLSPLNFIA